MEDLGIVRHVSGLVTSPIEAMKDAKKSGWVTPVLCVAASVGGMCNLPWRSPDMLLRTLEVWGLLQVLGVAALWAAGLTQGGRGSLAQTARVVGLLTLVDGLAFYYVRWLLPPIAPLVLGIFVVLLYLGVKALHEYENDSLAFRVTCSAFFLFRIMMVLAFSRLNWPLPF